MFSLISSLSVPPMYLWPWMYRLLSCLAFTLYWYLAFLGWVVPCQWIYCIILKAKVAASKPGFGLFTFLFLMHTFGMLGIGIIVIAFTLSSCVHLVGLFIFLGVWIMSNNPASVFICTKGMSHCLIEYATAFDDNVSVIIPDRPLGIAGS